MESFRGIGPSATRTLRALMGCLLLGVNVLGQEAPPDTLRYGGITGSLQPVGTQALVIIYKDTLTRVVTADSLTGRFELSQLPAGTYSLYVQMGYGGKRYVVQGRNVRAGEGVGQEEREAIKSLLTRLRDAVGRKSLKSIAPCYSQRFRNPQGLNFSQWMNVYRGLLTDPEVLRYTYTIEVVDVLRSSSRTAMASVHKLAELQLKGETRKVRSNEIISLAKEGEAWKITSETRVGLFAPPAEAPENLEARVVLRPPFGTVTISAGRVTDCGTLSILEFFKGNQR